MFVGRASGLQQLLDEIDAAARAVALVASDHVGRASRGAEAAMDAGAQNFFEARDMRIGELVGAEMRLHQMSGYMRPGLNRPSGSKLALTPRVRRASACVSGGNTSTCARNASGARM